MATLNEDKVLSRIKARAPKFTSLSDSDLRNFISFAAERFNTSLWTRAGKYVKAVALMAMHMLESRQSNQSNVGGGGGGAGGPLSEVETGKLSVSYDTGSVGSSSGANYDQDLSQTKWGRELQSLKKELPTTPQTYNN